jgi:hypothetical protein
MAFCGVDYVIITHSLLPFAAQGRVTLSLSTPPNVTTRYSKLILKYYERACRIGSSENKVDGSEQ